jgi:hypothetical protein
MLYPLKCIPLGYGNHLSEVQVHREIGIHVSEVRLIWRWKYISEFQIDMGRWENFIVSFRLIRRGGFMNLSQWASGWFERRLHQSEVVIDGKKDGIMYIWGLSW